MITSNPYAFANGVTPPTPSPYEPSFDFPVAIFNGQSPATGTIGTVGPTDPVTGDPVPTPSYYMPAAETLEAHPRALMLAGGLHSDVNEPAGAFDTLVALRESMLIYNGSYYSTVGAWAFVATLEQIQSLKYGITPTKQWIILNPARTGNSLKKLSKNTTPASPWQDVVRSLMVVDAYVDAYNLTHGTSKTWGIEFISMNEGAADNEINNGQLFEQYVLDALQYIADANIDFKAISGQTRDIFLYWIQDGSKNYRRPTGANAILYPLSNQLNTWVARAQLESALRARVERGFYNAWIKISNTQNSAGLIGVHGQPPVMDIWGEQMALCYEADRLSASPLVEYTASEVLVYNGDKRTWRAKIPTPAGSTGVLDTTRIAKQTRFGVRLLTDGSVPPSAAITVPADPVLLGDGADFCIQGTSSVDLVPGNVWTYGDPALGGNVKILPVTGPDQLGPIGGYEFGQWVLYHYCPITFTDTPLSTLSPSTIPPQPPEPPTPPPVATFQPQVIAPDSCVYLSCMDYYAGLTFGTGLAVTTIVDVIRGGVTVATGTGTAGQALYDPAGWHDGTPCLVVDGVANYYKTRQVPPEFPPAIPVNSAVREYWICAYFGADADTSRPIAGAGGGSGVQFQLTQVLVSGIPRARVTYVASGGSPATDLTTALSGYHWIRCGYDGARLFIQVDAGPVTYGANVTLATGTTAFVRFGTPSSGPTAMFGKYKIDWWHNAILSGDTLAAMHEFCRSLMPAP